MRKIGVLGGMSWESSQEFYRLLNTLVKERAGGLHSARLVMSSVDFGPIAEAMNEGRWNEIGEHLAGEARALERAGAEFFLIASNTMHRMAGQIAGAVSIPFLHIVDVTGEAARERGLKKVGLLGTRFTMADGFWAERMERGFGIEVLVPDAEERELVNRVIFDELCLGQVRAESRAAYARVIAGLVSRGAEAVVLGCTEIAMLISQEDSAVPLLDTTRLHAEAAIERAFSAPPVQAAAVLGLAT